MEVIHEWIIYTKHMYYEGLLYVNDITHHEGQEIVVTQVSTRVGDSKRFHSREEAWDIAKKVDQKVALLERKAI